MQYELHLLKVSPEHFFGIVKTLRVILCCGIYEAKNIADASKNDKSIALLQSNDLDALFPAILPTVQVDHASATCPYFSAGMPTGDPRTLRNALRMLEEAGAVVEIKSYGPLACKFRALRIALMELQETIPHEIFEHMASEAALLASEFNVEKSSRP